MICSEGFTEIPFVRSSDSGTLRQRAGSRAEAGPLFVSGNVQCLPAERAPSSVVPLDTSASPEQSTVSGFALRRQPTSQPDPAAGSPVERMAASASPFPFPPPLQPSSGQHLQLILVETDAKLLTDLPGEAGQLRSHRKPDTGHPIEERTVHLSFTGQKAGQRRTVQLSRERPMSFPVPDVRRTPDTSSPSL